MITNEYESLISTNPIYQEHSPRWKFLFESYVGGETYRKGKYLNKYATESNDEYAARLAATPLDNQCSSVISVYNSFLFRQCPEREFGSLEGSPEVEDFLKDADYEGRSLDNFMKEVSTWSGVFGHCWVILSKPNIGATTRADEQAAGVRPYASILNPLIVIDWSWERLPTGRYALDYLKYVEEMNGSVRTIKEWTPTEITTTIADDSKKVILSTEVEPNGIGLIPAVVAYNQRNIVRGIGVSAINDIADLQRFMYNAMSEVDQSIRLDSHPSIVVAGETQIGAGAGSVITMDVSLPSDYKPYMLEFEGANINNIYTAIENTIKSIEKVANIGSVRATQSKTLSGVAMETEFQLLNARLSEMADNLELAEEQLWRLWCIYQNQPFDVSIEYPGSFSIRDTGSEIEQLQKASSSVTSPELKKAIDIKVLDWLDLDEEEESVLEQSLLASGTTQIVETEPTNDEMD